MEGRKGGEAPELQLAEQVATCTACNILQFRSVREEFACFPQKGDTCLGQRETPRVVPQQELHAELALQLSDRRGDRGLGDQQILGSRRHTAAFSGCHEVAKLHQGERGITHPPILADISVGSPYELRTRPGFDRLRA